MIIRVGKRILSSLSNLSPHHNEVVRGSATALILKSGGLLLSFIFNLYMARVYGAAVIGTFALSVTVAGIFVLLGQMGTKTSIMRFIASHSAHNDSGAVRQVLGRTIAILIPSALVVGAGMYAFSTNIAPLLFQDPMIRPAFIITAMAVPFLVIAEVNASALRGLKRILPAFVFQAAFTPSSNLLLLFCLTSIFTTHSLLPLWANSTTAAFSLVASTVILLRVLPSGGQSAKRPVEPITEILKTSMPMMMSASMLLILNWTNILMLGFYLDTDAVGLFRIASRVSMLTSLSLVAVNSIIAPKFSELFAKGELKALKQMAQFAARLIFWTSIPILLAFLLFAEPIMGIFGPQFKAAAYVLVALSLGQLVNAGCGSVGYMLDMTGNQKSFRNILMMAAGFNILANTLLIPRFGILGAGIATALSTIIWNLGASYRVYRIYGFWVGFRPVFKALRENS